ncbi:hypothetical protein TL16_g07576 [Triparma laevis f. inornata]|uniref:Uncharacterized protein n=1 Tax=Triparma laevis f. inornata TaxID=1714386 RepID=A0A9W7AU68_9STRA|nr:hypothetical protein TL16_g07576 [Triparma laevis f. inornata]
MSDISSDSLNDALGINNDLDSEDDDLSPLSPLKVKPESSTSAAWSIPNDNTNNNIKFSAPQPNPPKISDKSYNFLTNVASALASPVRGDGPLKGIRYDIANVKLLDRGDMSEPEKTSKMKIKEVESENPQSFSGLSQKQLGESAEALRALDKELLSERSRYDSRGCSSISSLLKKRLEIAQSSAHSILTRIHSVKKEKSQNEQLSLQQFNQGKGASKIAHPRAFWGIKQAASYLKSVRVRTMAFVYKDNSEELPVAINDEVAFRACKRCRDKVAAEILNTRDSKVDHACRRAVGVGGRWGPHQLPDSLRFKNYQFVDARLGGKWVSSYVYDPLRSYLNPTLTLDDGGGGEGKDLDGLNNFESNHSEFRRTFQTLKSTFEAETTDNGRRKKLGVMLRSLDSFMSSGVAVDPQEHTVKLPGDYGGGGFKPPEKYGMDAKGKVMMLTSIDETAFGASIARLVQKVFKAWVKVVGFRMLVRDVFEWGRRRMLKLVWKPLFVHWRVMSAAKEVGEVEGGLRLLRRMVVRWRRFGREMRAGKVRFIRRLFVRRVQYIVKAWSSWARRKGKKKRVADAHWFKKGREIGFDRWHTWWVETARLKKYGKMIYVKRVMRVLRTRFAEWHRKIIVNRRLLKRVFTIGIEFSEHFKQLRGNREKSEFNLMRDIVMAWRKTVLERVRNRTIKMNFISRRMLWEATLVSKTFLAWQRYSYCAVVSMEFRAEGETKQLRRIFAQWERWSYRIIRVRHRWTVRKPLEKTFENLRLGCDVSRMSRMVVFKKVWGRWEAKWIENWKNQPDRFRDHWLLKHVVREWAWLVGEIGAERRCGFSVGGDGFYYRPFMSKRRLVELEKAEKEEKEEEEQVEVEEKTKTETHNQQQLLGVSAIDTYRRLAVLKNIFGWWSGISGRRRHLRRNLGSLSRLSLRLKLLDGFSHFPGFGNNEKVEGFRTRKLKKMIFKEWKVFSDTYMKRIHDDDLHNLLREKRRRKEELLVDEEFNRSQNMAKKAAQESGAHYDKGSFLKRVNVSNYHRLRQSWFGWKRLTILCRENRIQRSRLLRIKNHQTKKIIFEAWADDTHFINRRSSFAKQRIESEQGMKGRRGSLITPFTDKSMMLLNFINSGSGGGKFGDMW